MQIVSTKLLVLLLQCSLSLQCIPAGQKIEPGQDCRDCNYDHYQFNEWPGWRCNSGECVNKYLVCDGNSECPDGSDESPATCCASTCPSDPDICIEVGQEILPGQDCRNCTYSWGHAGWRCNTGQCVPKWKVCNGSPQCPDGSDESPATCCTSTCPSDPDICILPGQEIKPGQDCRDCTHQFWGPGWRCNNGQCLVKRNICNGGKPECPDGSDESPTTCCPSTCPSDPDICIQAGQEIKPGQDCRDCTQSGEVPNWRCNNGQCVLKLQVCDGSPDCSDGEDESPATCCASTCPSDPDICFPPGQEIKPGQDCRNCTYSTGIFAGWRCNSGQCVGKWKVCDGSPQCSDGSDESLAICCAATCPTDPDICIPAGQEIKPEQDCRDCTTFVGHPGWRCNSGQCIEKYPSFTLDGSDVGSGDGEPGVEERKYRVCNGTPDCSDGSDESPVTCSFF